jgi:multiple sugar transport system substrate-binding protein
MRRLLMLGAALACAGLSLAAQAADLNVWGIQTFNPDGDRYIADMVAQFGKAHGITAEYSVIPANVLDERLAAAFAGGTPPDVFMQVGEKAQYYIGHDLVAPVDDVIAKMRAVPGGVFENVLVEGKAGAHYEAAPLEIDVVPMFARTDLLAEVGMKLPTTWDEFRAAAKAIQAKHPLIAGAGIGMSDGNDSESAMRMIIWSFGGHLFGPDGHTVTFDSPETRAAMEYIRTLFEDDKTIPRSTLTWDDSSNNTAYQTGRAAFVINTPSIFTWLQQNDQKLLANTALISIPAGPGGQHGNEVAAWVWLVSKAGKHQDQARAFLEDFYQPDNYKNIIEKVNGRWLPIYKSMMSIPMVANVPQYAHFNEMANTGLTVGFQGPPTPLAGQVYAAHIVSSVVQKILVDHQKIPDATAWGQQQIAKLAAGAQ